MVHGSTTPEVVVPRSRFYDGAYGRLCPDLPPWLPRDADESRIDALFLKFASEKMVDEPGAAPAAITGSEEVRRRLEGDLASKIPAGYTYFGQFIDHDITFDPASSLMRQNDPGAIHNFRTPRLDLDSVYGCGPRAQPYLYDQRKGEAGKMLTGGVPGTGFRDLPRNVSPQQRALIGDARNDENAIVSQVHLAFILAHNRLVDRARAKGKADPFEAARRTLRWLYQYIVWNDFVRRVTSSQVHDSALKPVTDGGLARWELGFKSVYAWKKQPFMPVEFSVAAFRFGHAMVRNDYVTSVIRTKEKPVPIVDNSGPERDDLRGSRAIDLKNVLQWNWFLEMSSPTDFPQRARRIRTRLSNALAFLHEGAPGSPILRDGTAQSRMNFLAYRNLKRGWSFGLPAGSAMAKKYGIPVLDPPPKEGSCEDTLWFYILREAESLSDNRQGQLGALGSLIVCATFAGLLKGDPSSFVNVEPGWTPDKDDLLEKGNDNAFEDPHGDRTDPEAWTLTSIIRLAGLPVDAADIRRGQNAA